MVIASCEVKPAYYEVGQAGCKVTPVNYEVERGEKSIGLVGRSSSSHVSAQIRFLFTLGEFLAPTGAQGVKLCVRASVRPSVRHIMLKSTL